VRQRLSDLSVGARLGGAFLLVCALLVVVAAAGVWGVQRERSPQAELSRLTALADQIRELRYLDADVSGWQGYALRDGDRRGRRGGGAAGRGVHRFRH
jgi:methyl-accepting chemotaxis protein